MPVNFGIEVTFLYYFSRSNQAIRKKRLYNNLDIVLMSNHDKWNEMQNSMQQLIFRTFFYKRVNTDFHFQWVNE